MNQKQKAIVLGITGGIGSGKSSLARELEKHGATVIDADVFARKALLEPTIRTKLEQAFGSEIIDHQGNINRSLLAQKAFRNQDALQTLNSITHPWIRQAIQTKLEELLTDKTTKAIVLDIPLLLEAGIYEPFLDVVVFVDAPKEIREQRVIKNRSWEKGELERREAQQMPLEEKKQRSDRIIYNNGQTNDFAIQASKLWQHYYKDFK